MDLYCHPLRWKCNFLSLIFLIGTKAIQQLRLVHVRDASTTINGCFQVYLTNEKTVLTLRLNDRAAHCREIGSSAVRAYTLSVPIKLFPRAIVGQLSV